MNNQTNNLTATRPGYVLDLSALHGRRNRNIEGKREPRSIDAEPDATGGESE